MLPIRHALARATLAAALATTLAACTDELTRPPARVAAPSTPSRQLLSGPIDVPYGLSVGTFGLGVEEPDPTKSTAYANALRLGQAGIQWARVDFYWNSIQAGGRYSFDASREQYQIQRAADNNIKVVGTLYGIPAWMGDAWKTDAAAWQTFLEDWERYVTWVVANNPYVTHWSVWNEPNDTGFWSGTEAQYIELIQRAAPIIRGGGDKVVAPESAHSGDYLGFLGRVLSAAGNDIDVVSIHIYKNNVHGVGGLEDDVNRVIVETPLPATAWRWPLWVTEFGPLPYDPAYGGTQGSSPNIFDDGFQATHLQQTMDALASARTPFWERTFYWHMVDEWSDNPDGSLNWLLDRGLFAGEREGRINHNPALVTPRAAYYQYQTETSTRFAGHNVGYRAHVANSGWQPEVWNGRIAGMLQQTQSVSWASAEMQGIQIRLNNLPAGAGVEYQVSVRGQGWQTPVSNGQLAGTVGQHLAAEGIRISLVNAPSNRRICYRAYRTDGWWQAAACDGGVAGIAGGTTGVHPTLMALQIWLEVGSPDPYAAPTCMPIPTSARPACAP